MSRYALASFSAFALSLPLAGSVACSTDSGSDPADSNGNGIVPSDDDDDDEGDDDEGDDDDDDDDEGDDDDDDDDEGDDDLPKFDIGDPETGDPSEELCDLDFLFVIDNSGSMADEQVNLATSVPQFISTVEDTLELRSFHLGVTTTDAYTHNGGGCQGLGSFVVSTGGEESSAATCGPYSAGHNFMTDADDLDSVFACAARPGIEGNADEKPAEALSKAISPPLTDAGQCNEGFHRKDALLVVVVISDEEDDHEPEIFPGLPGNEGSAGDPDDWYQAVIDIKEKPENVVMLSLVGVPEPNECEQSDPLMGAELNVRIRELTERFGVNGFVGDVCAPSYGEFFEEAVSVIDQACDNKPE